MINGRLEAKRPPASAWSPSWGGVVLITLYSIGLWSSSSCDRATVPGSRGISSEPMSSCWLIWLPLHSEPMTSIVRLGLRLRSARPWPLLTPTINQCCIMSLCQILSCERQWQIYNLLHQSDPCIYVCSGSCALSKLSYNLCMCTCAKDHFVPHLSRA